MSYVGEKSAPCWPFVPIHKPRRPYRSKLIETQQKTEAARKPGGEENAVYELAAAMLLERAIAIKLECKVCSFGWEPAGLSDPLWRVAHTSRILGLKYLERCCSAVRNARKTRSSIKP